MKWQGSSVNKGLNSNKSNMFPPIKSIVKFNGPDFGNVFHQSNQLLASTDLIMVQCFPPIKSIVRVNGPDFSNVMKIIYKHATIN